MHKVYIETTNFNHFILEYKKITNDAEITDFLNRLEGNLEEEDTLSIYSTQFNQAKCYKISFNSKYNSVEDTNSYLHSPVTCCGVFFHPYFHCDE